MALSTLEKKLNAQAQMVLQIDPYLPKSIVGIAPTDEELVSLYENQLDTTRRAQLFSHIANNPDVHERWIRCVETLTYIDEIDNNSIKAISKENNKPGIFSSLSDFFNTKSILAGGFSTAAIIVIVVAILPQQKDFNVQLSFNEAYQQWGGGLASEWDSLPAAQKPTPIYSEHRSFFTTPKQKSKIQQVLETGFKLGIEKIGDTPFNDFGIATTTLSNISNSEVSTIMSTQQYDALIQTGNLAAFAALQCRLDSSSERLEIFSSALLTLRQQLAELQFNDAKALMSNMETQNKPAVCVTAQYVVDLITK
ncbi:MAG: hypothetical protein ACC657_15685 [Thiohalomonadales bacterium]